MAENRNTARKEVPVRRSAVSARYWRKHLEKTEAEKILREKLGSAEKILVGIGSEWKKKEGAEEEEILHAAEQLKKFLDGKDYYMITSLADEDAKRLPFVPDILRSRTAYPLRKKTGNRTRCGFPAP